MSAPAHVYEIYIATTPEKLWEALTKPDLTVRYFHHTRIQCDWTKGAPLVYAREDGSRAVEGEVLEVDPPRRLSFTWRTLYDEAARRERPSRVTFEIEALGEVCRLALVHDDFEPGSVTYANVSRGWNAIVCSLKTLLETGAALPPAEL